MRLKPLFGLSAYVTANHNGKSVPPYPSVPQRSQSILFNSRLRAFSERVRLIVSLDSVRNLAEISTPTLTKVGESEP